MVGIFVPVAKCVFVVSVEPCSRTIGCEMLLNGTARPDLPLNVYREMHSAVTTFGREKKTYNSNYIEMTGIK